MKTIIAIDPGSSGGIAIRFIDGTIGAHNMPDGMTGFAAWLSQTLETTANTIAVMEDVGYHMKGNSATASCKFARHCGHLEAILYMRGIATTTIRPLSWQKAIGIPQGMDKGDRKNSIKERMQRLYPHLKVSLKTADALGILTAVINGER